MCWMRSLMFSKVGAEALAALRRSDSISPCIADSWLARSADRADGRVAVGERDPEVGLEPLDRVGDLTAVVTPQDHVERVLSLVHRQRVVAGVGHVLILADGKTLVSVSVGPCRVDRVRRPCPGPGSRPVWRRGPASDRRGSG